MISSRESRLLLTMLILALAVSAIQPYDGLTWWLETFPVLLGLPQALQFDPSVLIKLERLMQARLA